MWLAVTIMACFWVAVFGYALIVLAGDEDEASIRRWDRQQDEWRRDGR